MKMPYRESPPLPVVDPDEAAALANLAGIGGFTVVTARASREHEHTPAMAHVPNAKEVHRLLRQAMAAAVQPR